MRTLIRIIVALVLSIVVTAPAYAEVTKNRADYGVVPVENSTEGVVTHTLDMFVESELKIVAQIILSIQHCLVSNSRRDSLKKLYAHPQTLAQCRGWVQNHLPQIEIIETSSNARSAEGASNRCSMYWVYENPLTQSKAVATSSP